MAAVKSAANHWKRTIEIMPGPLPTISRLEEALATIERFVAETTGQPPSEAELADALQRYFVLNEIKGHIEMLRQKT
jgi:hypothetical protein